MTRTASYPLRLSRSAMRVARETAEREGISLNQFIGQAVAEKLSALLTEDMLRDRAARADWERVRAILDRSVTEPPREGDEVPAAPKMLLRKCWGGSGTIGAACRHAASFGRSRTS